MNNWVKNRWAGIAPLVMLFILFGIYLVAQFGYIECSPRIRVSTCREINPGYILLPAPDDVSSPKLIDENNKLIPDKKTDAPGDPYKQNRQSLADRYSGRLLTIFMIAVYFLFCLVAFYVFFHLIAKSLKSEKPSNFMIAGALIAAALVISFFLSSQDTMPLLTPFIKTIEDNAGGIPEILKIIQFVNSFGYSATLMFVFTVCVILYSANSAVENVKTVEDVKLESAESAVQENAAAEVPASSQTADEKGAVEKDAETGKTAQTDSPEIQTAKKKLGILSAKKKDLETALLVASILLIAGVLRAKTVNIWAVAFLTPDAAKTAESFLAHVTTVLGGFFTLLLASAYLPAIYIIQQHGTKLSEESGVALSEEDKTSFMFSLRESLPQVLAVAAPLLTGPIAELFNHLQTK